MASSPPASAITFGKASVSPLQASGFNHGPSSTSMKSQDASYYSTGNGNNRNDNSTTTTNRLIKEFMEEPLPSDVIGTVVIPEHQQQQQQQQPLSYDTTKRAASTGGTSTRSSQSFKTSSSHLSTGRFSTGAISTVRDARHRRGTSRRRLSDPNASTARSPIGVSRRHYQAPTPPPRAPVSSLQPLLEGTRGNCTPNSTGEKVGYQFTGTMKRGIVVHGSTTPELRRIGPPRVASVDKYPGRSELWRERLHRGPSNPPQWLSSAKQQAVNDCPTRFGSTPPPPNTLIHTQPPVGCGQWVSESDRFVKKGWDVETAAFKARKQATLESRIRDRKSNEARLAASIVADQEMSAWKLNRRIQTVARVQRAYAERVQAAGPFGETM